MGKVGHRNVSSSIIDRVFRLMHRSSTMNEISIDRLKEHRTFVKYKSNGKTYSRIYFLNLAEDAIEYLGSRNSSKDRRCKSKAPLTFRIIMPSDLQI